MNAAVALLSKATKKTSNLTIALTLALVQLFPLVAIQPASADGSGTQATCENLSVGVTGSITGTADLVTHDAGIGKIVDGVCIKSGAGTFGGVTHSGVLVNGTFDNGCYKVTGVGTQNVTVTRLVANNVCKGISHIDAVTSAVGPKTGSITIKKNAISDSDQVFSFTTTGLSTDATGFTLVDDSTAGLPQHVFSDLPAADYTVTESATAGWYLDNISCQSLLGSSVVKNSSKVTITLKQGDDVTCTFKNRELQEPEVDYCDPTQKPGGVSIHAWLTAQNPVPECVDYEVVNVCGSLSVKLTKNETPYTYGFSYSEHSVNWNFNTDASNISFPEDYNGGSVDVYFWGVGSEKDYFTANGLPWFEIAAKKAVVNTNCEPDPATVKVSKVVKNNNGGTALATDFDVRLNNDPLVPGVPGSNGPHSHVAYEPVSVKAGTEIKVTEENVPHGYALVSIECKVSGQVVTLPYVVQAEDEVRCNVINRDKPARIKIVKLLKQDNGATDPISSFSFKVNGGDSVYFDENGKAAVTVPAGTYTVSENETSAYKTYYEGCKSIVLDIGEEATCVIRNDDLPAYLTLYKYVINDNGGQLGPLDFPLTITGDGYFNYTASGIEVMLNAGQYTVGEVQQEGYKSLGWDALSGDCSWDGNITVVNGGKYDCTITNKDLPGVIIVHKKVINDNGGKKSARDFRFKVDDGEWQNFSRGYAVVKVDAGTHTVVEDEHYSYEASYRGCKRIHVKNGEIKHCYITNDDKAPKVTVEKRTWPHGSSQDFEFELTNSATERVWSFALDGNHHDDDVPSRRTTGETFPAGVIDISETEMDGWDLSRVKCFVKSRQGAERVKLPFEAQNGRHYRCTFTNTQRNSVTVTKFSDENQNGMWDEGEVALPGWDITLSGGIQCEVDVVDSVINALVEYGGENGECEAEAGVNLNQTTGDDGTTTFVNLRSGEYTVGEVQQAGWTLTNVYCDLPDEYDDERVALFDNGDSTNNDLHDTATTRVRYGDMRNCYVGNYQIPDEPEEPEEPEEPGQVLGVSTSVPSQPAVLADTGIEAWHYALTGTLLVAAAAGITHRRKKLALTR